MLLNETEFQKQKKNHFQKKKKNVSDEKKSFQKQSSQMKFYAAA
jgi:hypothetical protein